MNNKSKRHIVVAAIIMGLTVMLGAFGSHFLDKHLTVKDLNTFDTGIRYQFIHGISLLIIAVLRTKYDNKWMRVSWKLMLLGMLLFSVSLYLLSLNCRDTIFICY